MHEYLNTYIHTYIHTHTYTHTHTHRLDGKFAMTVGRVASHKHTKYTKYSRDTDLLQHTYYRYVIQSTMDHPLI